MDQHLGASITLSFGLVVVFAIVLYQPDSRRTDQPASSESTPRVADVEAVALVPSEEESLPRFATEQPALTEGEPLPSVIAPPPPAPTPVRASTPARAERLANVRPPAESTSSKAARTAQATDPGRAR